MVENKLMKYVRSFHLHPTAQGLHAVCCKFLAQALFDIRIASIL
jgi:hypothetical protein